MRTKTQRSVGRHRKVVPAQTAKGRIALVTAAAGAVSTAGVGGAAAAQVTGHEDNDQAQSVDIDLAADNHDLAGSAKDAAPQILAMADKKPVDNLQEQLDKAVNLDNARQTAEAAARDAQQGIAGEGSADLSSLLGGSSASILRPGSTVKPAEGQYTSGFEMRWGQFHAGIDIANAMGTPIVAAQDGEVISSGPASGFGQWIRIQHDDGTITVYGHMETLDVNVGDHVTAGQKIAGMGSRGFSTGTHLHFEVHPAGGSAIDPVPWLAERGISL